MSPVKPSVPKRSNLNNKGKNLLPQQGQSIIINVGAFKEKLTKKREGMYPTSIIVNEFPPSNIGSSRKFTPKKATRIASKKVSPQKIAGAEIETISPDAVASITETPRKTPETGKNKLGTALIFIFFSLAILLLAWLLIGPSEVPPIKLGIMVAVAFALWVLLKFGFDVNLSARSENGIITTFLSTAVVLALGEIINKRLSMDD
jgi:hypothetical protein